MVQWLTNPIRNHGVGGSIPGLAEWVKNLNAVAWVTGEVWVQSPAQHSGRICFAAAVGHKCSSHSIPDLGTKIPHKGAERCDQKNKS